VGRFKPERLKYAKKKSLCKCLKCEKYKAIRKGKRRGKERFKCLACGYYFQRGKTKKEKIDKQIVLADHLERASYRILSSRYGKSKNELYKLVENELKNIPDNYEITKKFRDKLEYLGRLIVDGKYVPIKENEDINPLPIINIITGKRKRALIPRSAKRARVRKGKTLIWGCEYDSHDIPHFELGDSENGIVLNDYFRKLKILKYPLISLTTDDKDEIARAARRHYPEAIVQLCIRHYLRKITRELGIGAIKMKIKSLEKKVDKLFGEDDKNTYLPTTRYWTIKTAKQLINQILDISFNYELSLEFEASIIKIITAHDYTEANKMSDELLNDFWPKMKGSMKSQFDLNQIKKVGDLIADFRDKKEYLINYLKYPHLHIPSTSNMIEGYNSQLELRLSSIRGFENIANAKYYLNAWIIKRRLTKFTDCRKKFKKLNGRSPLECAGVDNSDISNLNINGLIRQKKREN
jgi:transposase-like protein